MPNFWRSFFLLFLIGIMLKFFARAFVGIEAFLPTQIAHCM